MPAVAVDGHDFFAVYEAAGEAIKHARGGGGPAFIECRVNRYYGHFEGDAQTYRGPDEVDKIRAERDCIDGFIRTATEALGIEKAEFDTIDQEIAELIDSSVTDARSDPKPQASDLLTDVYVSY